MFKNHKMPPLMLMLLLGWTGRSQAHPLDSRDIVYIDGLPCNAACQSYMSWSRQLTSSLAPPAQITRRSSYAVRRASTRHRYNSEPVSQARVARPVVPLPPTKTAELSPAGKAAAASEVTGAHVTASPSAGGAVAVSRSRTVQEQVAAAAALAEHVTATATPRPPQDVNNTDTWGRAQSVRPADAEQSASVAEINTDDLVALVMTRPEIKSIADLAGRDVAIEEQQSASSGVIRTAIAASGAAEVQLSPGRTKAIDRMISGEVPAAVLTLVSTEAAEWFPEIAGFRIYRVPLSPRELK
jgi:hypothetical protein